MIQLEQVSAGYGQQTILHDFSLRIARGEHVALAGANGTGKSTLLRVISGMLKITSGTLKVDGHKIQHLSARERARLIAVVPQEIPATLPLTAYDFVMLGRTPFLPRFRGAAASDQQAVRNAMHLVNTWHLRQRLLSCMSSGERQRLALAMALAATPSLLLLDEPTAHLDLRHRVELMQLLKRLNLEQGITSLTVVHDLTLASQFFPRMVLLGQTSLIADGTPGAVLHPDFLRSAYGCNIQVWPLPEQSTVMVWASAKK